MAQDAPGVPDISAARQPRPDGAAVPAPSPPTTGDVRGGAIPERPAPGPGRAPGPLARVPAVAAVVLGIASALSAVTALIPALRHALAPVQEPLDLLLINASPR
ncbi:MAG TPA: hypothetical protein VEV65_14030 [Kineosporiaceae bacterium]|nr:hypothetical protein [Kineosporiaceae bacterium]